ncbi:hypothetical protein ARSEF4850_002420 [Beauveria asiatica]
MGWAALDSDQTNAPEQRRRPKAEAAFSTNRPGASGQCQGNGAYRDQSEAAPVEICELLQEAALERLQREAEDGQRKTESHEGQVHPADPPPGRKLAQQAFAAPCRYLFS